MTAVALFVGVVGLLFGSFANVVIGRLPAGESIVSPPSACPACHHRIRPWDNIPVLSWLALKARCRDCKAPISPRYPLVELAGGAGFTAVALALPDHPLLWPAGCWVVFLALTLTLIDLEHHRLPNALTLPATPVLLALLAVPAAAYGMWDQWTTAALAGLALFGLFGALWFAYPAGMGLGDVKLAPAIGVALGWAGWSMLAFGTFAMFLLGGLAGGVVMAVAARRHGANVRQTAKTGLPFGPFMFAGVLAAVCVGQSVISWYAGFMPQG